jgi:excisionase family DNA binding protein
MVKSEVPIPGNGLFTARAAASYLRVSLTTLSKIEKEGWLRPYRTPGGHRRYNREMLDTYLEASRFRWDVDTLP